MTEPVGGEQAPDLVVVGGGVIGLAAAWLSARAGLAVTVVDPCPGLGASWVAAGMLAPVSEATFGEDRLTALLVAAAARWAGFAAELEAASGCSVGYRRTGTLVVAVDQGDRAVLDQLLAYQHALGLEATRLTASACRTLEPALAPGVCGGVDVPGDHQVDNRRLLAALDAALPAAGVTVLRRRVERLVLDRSGSAAGVVLDDGAQLSAPQVVLAVGCEAARLEGVPEGVLPSVRPVKGHILRLAGDPDHPLVQRTVRGLVRGRPCYLVPRADGSLVVGATAEERGFDRRVQAGAVHALLDDARTLVPGIDDLELVECSAGLRPGSPDNGPFVGWTAVPGLAVAAGHHRNGILLAPLTADAVASLVTGGAPPDALAGFGAARPVGVPT